MQLTIDQIPSHSHSDEGHSHAINLNTHHAGEHTHHYKDSFYSGGKRPYFNDYIQVPHNFGSSGSDNEPVNCGWQITRETLHGSGNHNHNIQGNTAESKAYLSNTGGNLDHENLPPYYVVAYIIYLKD